MKPIVNQRELAQLYDTWASNVYAYALRHCGREGAEDVVSEVFVVACRRSDDIPDDALPWLLVVARNVIANRRRSERRREHLHLAMASRRPSDAAAAEEIAIERAELLVALRALHPRDREAILLTAWDGLDAGQAAEVAGCRERAFRGRLTKARQRLEAAMNLESPHRTPHALSEGIAR